MSNIGEVVRGNVAGLFGRFRPPAGKSASEIAAVKAERVEFGDRLIPSLKLMSADAKKIERATRDVFKEIESSSILIMPDPEAIAASVRDKLNVTEKREDCAACVEFGGVPAIFRDKTPGAIVMRGDVLVDRTWLCFAHHEPVSWFLNRQKHYESGLKWPYPPSFCLVPEASYSAGAEPNHYWEYTDGMFISPLGYWVREQAESVLGKPLLDEPAAHV
jgi:hypothetical protein